MGQKLIQFLHECVSCTAFMPLLVRSRTSFPSKPRAVSAVRGRCHFCSIPATAKRRVKNIHGISNEAYVLQLFAGNFQIASFEMVNLLAHNQAPGSAAPLPCSRQIICRFCAPDLLKVSRESMGAPADATIYALDGSLISRPVTTPP